MIRTRTTSLLATCLAAGCALSAVDELPAGDAPAATTQPAARASWAALAGAERVLLGTVEQVSAAFGLNEHGDRLIISTIAVRVEETLRGESAALVTLALEGGTVGELTLEVSDLPRLAPGDRALFALRRDRLGSWVPHLRGVGILRAGPADELAARLEAVRRAALELR